MVLTRFLRAPHFLTLPIWVKSALFAPEGVGGAGFHQEITGLCFGLFGCLGKWSKQPERIKQLLLCKGRCITPLRSGVVYNSIRDRS